MHRLPWRSTQSGVRLRGGEKFITSSFPESWDHLNLLFCSLNASRAFFHYNHSYEQNGRQLSNHRRPEY